MRRVFFVATLVLASTSFARPAPRSLLHPDSPPVSLHQVRVVASLLERTPSLLSAATLMAGGGVKKTAPAAEPVCPSCPACAACPAPTPCPVSTPSASNGRTLDSLQLEWRGLEASRPSLNGIGLSITGVSLLIFGTVMAAAFPSLFASFIGGLGYIYTIFSVVGVAMALIGAALLVWGGITLVFSILERNQHQRSMDAIQKEIDGMKRSENSAGALTPPLRASLVVETF